MVSATNTKIFMIKKSNDQPIVSFRMGTKDGIEPGMHLEVVNECGIMVGEVQVQDASEDQSEASVLGGGDVNLSCYVKPPGMKGKK